ncbi:MAG: hypothetical protein F4Y79_12540 [Gemmatimonadetes bacterium]|nr:hypothetical protein [Gemmatimonadota bacterium]
MQEEIFNFFNQGWVGSLIGIVGLIIGWFLYKKNRRIAKPSFQKSSLRLLGGNEDNLPREVTILFKGEEVDRLTKTTLILWNNGTEVLDGEKIVGKDPIKISFNEGDSILSYKILQKTKEVNDFSVSRDEDNSHQLLIEFSYLDPSDGISLELLHDSKKRYPKVQGSIMGLPKGFEDLGIVYTDNITPFNRTPLAIVLRNRKMVYWIAIGLGLGMVVIGLLPQEFRGFFSIDSSEEMRPRASLVMICLGLLYTAMPVLLLWVRRKKYPRSLEITEIEP